MTKYETAILFDPELPEEQRKEFLAKLSQVIGSFQGDLLKQDDWGVRKLAYPIRKKANAYYTFLLYSGERGVVEEVERNLMIFEGSIRHMTSRADGKAPAPSPAAAEPAAEAAPAEPPSEPLPGPGR